MCASANQLLNQLEGQVSKTMFSAKSKAKRLARVGRAEVDSKSVTARAGLNRLDTLKQCESVGQPLRN